MSTGQTLLTLGAMALLSTVLLNFYRLSGASSDQIASGQDGILATTIATSYMEIAKGVAFDSVTDTSDIALYNPSVLTSPAALGPETADEDSIYDFNDFDDFDDFTAVKVAEGTGRTYTTKFKVNYVSAANVETISATRTFLKRLDLKTWRSFPPATSSAPVDTLRFSLVMGYFHFD
jgi:hypothetical protein